jgi:hypothetical protein
LRISTSFGPSLQLFEGYPERFVGPLENLNHQTGSGSGSGSGSDPGAGLFYKNVYEAYKETIIY